MNISTQESSPRRPTGWYFARRLLKQPRRTLGDLRERILYTWRHGRRRTVSPLVSKYIKLCQSRSIDSNLVFYESHVGAGAVCNPLAIFRSLLRDPRRGKLRHIWVLNDADEITRLQREYSECANVEFVLRDSDAYIEALATAKYIVQNTSYPPYFTKRPGQICINTWHSTTVKTLGFDMPDGNIQSRNLVRSFLISDYLVSPNPFMTQIFRNSYRLQNLFPGKIIETGYPRNDLTIAADRVDVIQRLRDRGVQIDPNKKVILYAPTWRGSSAGEARAEGARLLEFRDQLAERIDTATYQVLIKPHHLTEKALSETERASGQFIPRHVDANELLAIVDLLISDYSSIFIDFMITGRPVIFYLPDKDDYDRDRGIYFSLDELPGPVADSIDPIADWIADIDHVRSQYADRYDRMRTWACGKDDGRASERVIQIAFDGEESEDVIDDFLDDAKPRLLFYVSGFAANGVTSAFKALLDRIDRDAYDITVYGILNNAAGRRNFRELRGVRAMPRFGGMALTRREAFAIEYVMRYGLDGPLARLLKPQEALLRDYRRSFGDADFDYLIDFSGYGTMFPSIFRQRPNAKKIIWQHTDITAEFRNRRKRDMQAGKGVNTSIVGIRDTYKGFDRIVACGEAAMNVNRRKLGTRQTEHKFTYVNNLVDAGRVRRLLAEQSEFAYDGYIVAYTDADATLPRLVLLPDTPPAPASGSPYIKFVAVGRLSPEKNYENLIRGFALHLREYPNCRLYILGGGPQHRSLNNLSEELGVGDRVSIPGHISNPFMVARHCDCFIMPSRYEGFGLVVPEMRMLGLPIILANFASVGNVSVPNGQYMIGFSAEEIRRGLAAFAVGKVPTSYEFDVDAYNRDAYQQFIHMLETT